MKNQKNNTCIICGVPVSIETESELITCPKDYCIMTVENSIGLHYVIGCDTAKPGGDISAVAVYQDGKVVNVLKTL